MLLLVADIVQLLNEFIWPLVRISAFLLAGPFFSLTGLNLRIRVSLILILTWLMFPLIDIPDINPFSFGAVGGIFTRFLSVG